MHRTTSIGRTLFIQTATLLSAGSSRTRSLGLSLFHREWLPLLQRPGADGTILGRDGITPAASTRTAAVSAGAPPRPNSSASVTRPPPITAASTAVTSPRGNPADGAASAFAGVAEA